MKLKRAPLFSLLELKSGNCEKNKIMLLFCFETVLIVKTKSFKARNTTQCFGTFILFNIFLYFN